jgi:hypothetical protein
VALSCWQGGTRLCQNGQWRVIQGTCEGEEYYNPATDRDEILVGAPGPSASAPVSVGAAPPPK